MRNKQNNPTTVILTDDSVIITKKKLECIRAGYYFLGAVVGIVSVVVIITGYPAARTNTPEDN